MITGAHDTVEELHQSREGLFFVMTAFVAVTMLGNFIMLCQDIIKGKPDYSALLSQAQDNPTNMYVLLAQVEEMKEKNCAVKICYMVTNFVQKKWTTFIQQITICSLFLTFWDEDHFVMAYIPGAGFAVLYFLQFMQTGAGLSALYLGKDYESSVTWYVSSCSCWACFCSCPVIFCMFGYFFYQLQFLLSTSVMHVMAEKAVFTVKFTQISELAADLGKYFFGLNVAELTIVAVVEGLASIC